ncbi:hypothetical protein QTP88_000618 [Uroleucon formosanum]
MLTLIDIILFLANQGVAFRGHIENETSLNQGNLKEACKLMAKYNPTFALNYAKSTNHTSWLIQNEIIEICAKHMPEGRTVSCVYSLPKNLKVEEKFIGFLDVSQSQNAESLIGVLLQLLNSLKLDKINIISSSKRRRREPTYLQQYAVMSTTSAEEDRVNNNLFGVSKDSLRSEMMVIKNVLKDNVDLEVLQNHLNSLNSKQNFPNYYKLFNVAITLPINSATCERSFSAMRRLKTWMQSTMLQERFSSLGIINIEKDINIDRISVLNDFAKSNRRINLILSP